MHAYINTLYACMQACVHTCTCIESTHTQNRFREKCKTVTSDLKTGCHFPRSRSFELKLMGKVPLTPSDVSTKFCWNNQNRFGEVQKI